MLDACTAHLRRYRPEVESHAHPHHQLVLAVDGTMLAGLGRRRVQVAPNTGLFVPRDEPHLVVGGSQDPFVILDVADTTLERLEARTWADTIARPTAFALAPAEVMLVRQAFGSLPMAGRVARDQWAALLVATMAENVRARSRRFDHRVATALAFIDARFGDPIEVAEIAAAAGLSASHLHELFSSMLGATPHAVLRERRLSHAARLLAGTDRPLVAVAIGCGFADQSTFTRAFRRHHGVTPGAWRRAHRP